MKYGYSKKAAAAVCIVFITVCVGITIAAFASDGWAWGSRTIPILALFGSFALASALLLIAVLNRRTTPGEDGFVYRTWLGAESEYRYDEVEWYTVNDDSTVHIGVRGKKLTIDMDKVNGPAVIKRLAAARVPDHDPKMTDGVFDDSGEQAKRVLYRRGRAGMAGIGIGFSAVLVLFGLGPVLLGGNIGGSPAEKALFIALWALLCCGGTAYFLHIALVGINARVELYGDHFIFRNALGKRTRYAYSDCVSVNETRFYNRAPAPSPNPRIFYVANIKMSDGSKITVDDRMLRDGLGAAIGYAGLPKKVKNPGEIGFH